MDLDDFDAALVRYGGDLDRWPAHERRAAEGLLGRSDAARRLLDEMTDLEDLIPLVGPIATPAAAQMAARAMQSPQARPWAPATRRAGWVAAVAAALLLGVLVGHGTGEFSVETGDHILTAASDPMGQIDVD